MTAIQNFAFDEHLVRSTLIEGAPWFVGKDVCGVLGIVKHNQALDALHEDERGTCSIGTPRGEQMMIIVNEPGVYRLVFTSRKPEAERFKRWLAHDVLPQIRRTGAYAPQEKIIDDSGEGPVAALRLRLDMVKTARVLWGPARAAAMWEQLGLPAAPPAPKIGVQDAKACLAHILDWRPEGYDLQSIRELLEKALADDGISQLELRQFGVRPVLDGPQEGFVIANRNSAELQRRFQGTEWDGMRWVRVLRRLPGAEPTAPISWGAGVASTRGTFLPAIWLDAEKLLE